MTVLFVYDHFFVRSPENIHSDKFSYPILARYLGAFDNVRVWGRVRMVSDKPENIMVSSGPRIDFSFGADISSLRSFGSVRKRAGKNLEKKITESDAVIVRLPSEYGMMAADLAQKHNKPWAVEVVGCAWDALWNYGGFKAKCYAPLAYWRMKSVVNNAPFALYVTSRFLQERYPPATFATTTNISNVELDEMDKSTLDRRLTRLASPRNGLVFGTIGSLKSRSKGIETAIKALARFSRNKPDIQFEYRVLGEGDRSPYMQLAERTGMADRVRFDGSLPGGAPVLEWLDGIDIYLHPSLSEGLPRALIEAMSRGCPAAGSDAGGIPELISGNMIHRAGDSRHLADILEKLTADHHLLAEEAVLNFERSMSYSKSILDQKRTEYLARFADYTEKMKPVTPSQHTDV